jgi:hypothetical protein
MIVIGHPYIDYRPFEKITSIADIAKSRSNATVLFDFHHDKVQLSHYAKEHEVAFALRVESEKEVILAAALGASYIICSKALAPKAQKFADDYLFDAKILLYSNNEEDILYAAEQGIDGILFQEGVKNGSD